MKAQISFLQEQLKPNNPHLHMGNPAIVEFGRGAERLLKITGGDGISWRIKFRVFT